MCSGCGNLIADKKSFVCHSTPHFGSTSREVSYSVRTYHTLFYKKSKSPIYKKTPSFMKIKYKAPVFPAKNS